MWLCSREGSMKFPSGLLFRVRAMNTSQRLNNHPYRRTSLFLSVAGMILYVVSALLLGAIFFGVYSLLHAIAS
jgi:hypothetical protein